MNSSKNDVAPQFVSFDFASGRLEKLVDSNGAIVEAPPNSTALFNPTLSPDGKHILARVGVVDEDSTVHNEVYHFDLNSGNVTLLYSDLSHVYFAWKNNSDYFVSLSEVVGESGDESLWMSRLYARSVTSDFSDWIVELEGKYSIKGLVVGDDNNIEFRCRAKNSPASDSNPVLEVCNTLPNPFHGSLVYDSHSFGSDVPFSGEIIAWPQKFSSIVYVPCSQGEKHNLLCSFDINHKVTTLVTSVTAPQVGSLAFDSYGKYVVIHSFEMYNV